MASSKRSSGPKFDIFLCIAKALALGLLLPCLCFANANGKNLRFRHITLEQGLSQANIFCLLQDRMGYLWVGTFIGLNRYDGKSFEVFRNDPHSPNSLPDSQIRALLEDRNGHLWVGTANGLCRFEGRDTNHPIFHNYLPDRKNPRALASGFILNLLEDHRGDIWIGTVRGLYRYVPETDDFERFDFWPNRINTLSGGHISDLAEDRYGQLWVATNRGISLLNQDRSSSQHLLKNMGDEAVRYSPKLIQRIMLRSKTGVLAEVRPSQNQLNPKYQFRIEKPQKVLMFGIGEHSNAQWHDQGRLLKDGKLIWAMENARSRYAGGAAKNRMCLAVLSLIPGDYELTYTSDDRHTWGLWDALPPDYSEGYGLRVIELPPETDEMEHLLMETHVGPSLKAGPVNSLLVDQMDRLWVGYARNGLERLAFSNGIGGELANSDRTGGVRQYPDLPGDLVRDLVSSKDGQIFVGTDLGLAAIDSEKYRLWKHDPLNPHSLSSNAINTLLEDREGHLWIGIELGGLNKLDLKDPVFEHVIPNPGAPLGHLGNLVYAFAELPENVLWVGTRSGLKPYHLPSQEFLAVETSHSESRKLSELPAFVLQSDDDGRLWIGTRRGLFFIRPKIKKALGPNGPLLSIQHSPLQIVKWPTLSDAPRPQITSLTRDQKGDLWVATFTSGVIHQRIGIDGAPRVVKHYATPNFNGGLISSIYCDTAGRIWVGSQNQGLFCINPATGEVKRFQHRPSDPHRLSHRFVTAIYDHPETGIWIGTYGGGLNRFDEQSQRFTRLTTKDGLPDDVVYGILPDDFDTLWVSTNQGVGRIVREGNGFRVHSFHMADGLQSTEFNRGAYFRGVDGTLVMGGVRGFNLIKPRSILEEPNRTKAMITGMTVSGEPRLFTKPFYQMKQIDLAPRENGFAFYFASFDFNDAARYAYQLQGIDREWVVTDERRSATYTHLKPGKYEFQVRHLDRVGRLGQTEKVAIFVQPMFYQTLWFRSLSFVFFSLLLYLAWFLRHRHLRKEKQLQQAFSRDLIETMERDRARVAAELHDGLGQNLLAMNNGLQFRAQSLKKGDHKTDILFLSDLVLDTLEEVRQIAYQLRPHQLDRLGLKGAISSMVKHLNQTTAVQFQVSLEFPNNALEKEQETHIYRMIQEALNNVIKHASASFVQILMVTEEDVWKLKIADNGTGMPPQIAGSKEGMGLRTMNERAKLLNGHFDLQSGAEKGTCIEVSIPTKGDFK